MLIGEKLNRKRIILIAWIFVVLLCISFELFLVFGYSKYSKFQDSCFTLLKYTDELAGSDIPDDEEEYLSHWHFQLSPDTRYFAGDYISEALADEMNETHKNLRNSVSDLFQTIDYPINWEPSYVFAYHDFADYCKGQFIFTYDRSDKETILNIAFLSFIIVSFICVLITQIIHSKKLKQKIAIDNDRILYQAGKKKLVIEASRITSIKKKPYHSIRITSPGKNITVSMLENQIDLVDKITDMMNNKRQPNISASLPNNQNSSVVQQLKEWKNLYDTGVITAEEYEAKKKSLLNSVQ